MKEINSNILSDITVHMKYAKYIPELKRRETWEELVDRNMAMHIKKYPELEVDIRKAYSYVFTKQILFLQTHVFVLQTNACFANKCMFMQTCLLQNTYCFCKQMHTSSEI